MGLLLNAEIENMRSILMFVDECSVESADTFYLYKNKLMTKSEKLARIYKAIGEEISSEILCDVSPDGEALGDWITETK